MRRKTGIIDKNSIEIMEGDMIHIGDPTIQYKVIKRSNDTEWMAEGCSGRSRIGLAYWQDRITVIG